MTLRPTITTSICVASASNGCRVNRCINLLQRNRILRSEDLNLPSIQVNDLVATRQITRSVRNTGDLQTFTARVNAPEGIELEVQPGQSFRLPRMPLPNTPSRSAATARKATSITGASAASNGPAPRTQCLQPGIRDFDLLRDTGRSARFWNVTGSVQIPVQFGYNGNYFTRTSGLKKLPAYCRTTRPMTASAQIRVRPSSVRRQPGFLDYFYQESPQASAGHQSG